MQPVARNIRRLIALHGIVGPGIGALILAALGITAALLNARALEMPEPSTTTIVVLTLLLTLPVALIRHFSLTALILITAFIIVYRQLGVPEQLTSSAAVFLAIYGSGAYSRSRRRNWVRAGVIVALFGFWFYSAFTGEAPDLPINYIVVQVYSFLFNLFTLGAAWVLGDVVRRGREHKAEVMRYADRLEREQEENARRAVVEERMRIARELHDVVAHHVSVMGVQAGAARRVLSRRPASGGRGRRTVVN